MSTQIKNYVVHGFNLLKSANERTRPMSNVNVDVVINALKVAALSRSDITPDEVKKVLAYLRRKAAPSPSSRMPMAQVENLLGPGHLAKMARERYGRADNTVTAAEYTAFGTELALKRFPGPTDAALRQWYETDE